MRRWVISGGGSGIGEAVARHAHHAGDRVVVLGRSGKVAALAGELGERATAISLDVRDRSALDAAAQRVQGELGGVDVLVASAGTHRGRRVERLPREWWTEVIDTNLTGMFDTVQAFLPLLPDGSSIVNVGSVAGSRAFPGDAAYAASKAGVAALTRVLAVELAARAITVNTVLPGFIDTPMTAALSPRAHEMVESRIPMGRMGSVAEVAEVVCWMASSRYMTGAEVAVDGGLMAALGSRA